MLVILDAWTELVDITSGAAEDINTWKVSLALGKDPLNTALLLPVGRIGMRITDAAAGTTQAAVGYSPPIEQLFRAQGTMWATQYIAIDLLINGTFNALDVDVHLDWTVANVDWWTWFFEWNRLEAHPDGSLVDGERAYA